MSASAPARSTPHTAKGHSGSTSVSTLRTLIEQRRVEGYTLSLDEAIAAVVPLCLDLKERHDRGERLYVHPSCVAPSEDGLARLMPHLAVLPTHARDKACLAPELQRTLEAGDSRASVFAIGAMLYEMVTGSTIGPGMRRPREIDPTLPASLELLLSKALVGDPKSRPEDLGALASAMHHLAPMKSIHPPDVDESTLDTAGGQAIDVRLSILPPHRSEPPPPSLPRVAHGGAASGDPLGQVIVPQARVSGPSVAQQLATLKARLEADPRPRFVVNKQRMDHGPFNAVELLQQIASNTFVSTDELRDELSGQARPIAEWDEFAPFAKHAQMARDIQTEKKEVARVEKAEKTSGVAKVVIAVLLIGAVVGGAAFWFLKVRGSRSDEVAVEDEGALDLDIDGGIKGGGGRRRGAGGRGAGGGGGGGGGFTGGGSFEAALAANNEQITIGGGGGGADLTNAQLGGPLKNATFISGCGAPDSMKVTVKVAVKMGRAVGVSVYTSPPNGAVSSCVDRHVRGLSWPANAKMDFVTTQY